jgi:hypothetical protein
MTADGRRGTGMIVPAADGHQLPTAYVPWLDKRSSASSI